MIKTPLLAILSGYGLAALAAALAAILFGAGAFAALLGFWLGGAALTLVCAAATSRRAASPATADPAADLALWEQDRRADAADAKRESRRIASARR